MVTMQSDSKKTANPLVAAATKTGLGRTYFWMDILRLESKRRKPNTTEHEPLLRYRSKRNRFESLAEAAFNAGYSMIETSVQSQNEAAADKLQPLPISLETKNEPR